jgi:hypothetical protein
MRMKDSSLRSIVDKQWPKPRVEVQNKLSSTSTLLVDAIMARF